MHEYKNKSILLVEDETIIALTQSAVLKKSGFNVKSVLSGEKAVALLESGETFDLILMDIDLGKGMSGTEAAEKILSMCDIPILFLSSHTEPEIVEKTEGITSYGYVVKNSGDTVLLASIRMAFRLFEEKVKVQRHKEQFQKLNEELEATNEELTAAMEELEAANEELLQSQGEILLSEEKFRRLFMSSNDGICLHEIIYNEKGDAADYRIIDVNPVYEDITGLKRIDVAGKSASGVYGTGAPPYLDVYSEVAETEVPKTFDVYFEPMDRHFHISVFSPGKGMFATAFQDITGKRRAEIQLRESEERYRALAEGSPNAIVVHQNGIIQYINETGLLLFGADSKEEITGTEFILRVHEDFREIVAERINKVSENLEKVPVFEEVMYRLNGEEFYAEVLSVPFWHNEELAVQTIIHDISDRIKVETELRKAVDEKGALLQELQHRVKNNLAMISGLIGLETIRSGDNKVIAVLKNLRSRIGALERLYSSLYHTGNVKEIRLDTYVSEIADSIMKTYISELQNIKIVTDFEPFVVSIKHAASIGLIANELLVNALKYAFPDGREGVITVTLKVSGPGYELAVTDNGIGLPQGFDVKGSTGSGIMIIDMLAEHMEGAFNFEAGEFTSFKVTVPFIE